MVGESRERETEQRGPVAIDDAIDDANCAAGVIDGTLRWWVP